MPVPPDQVALAAFSARLFRHLERSDQRRWGHTYLAALLATPGRKTVRRLAGTVSEAPGVARALNQFVNGSTWDWEPVLGELAAWAAERGRPRGWAIHPVLIPKRGAASAGVHHRFDPRSSRTVSCQLGLAGFGCAGVAVPAAWHLVLPAAWTDDAERRRRARIPQSEGQLPVWRRQLVMAERLCDAAAALPIVIEACDEADAVRLIAELAVGGRAFAVAVPATLPVFAGGSGSRRAQPAGRVMEPAGAGGESMCELGAGSGSLLGFPSELEHGAVRTGPASASFLTAVAHVPGVGGGGDVPCRLIAAQTYGGPARIWVTRAAGSEGAEGTSATYAASLARLGEKSAEAVTALRDGFGLADFEGRSFPGWHRHMTLVSAAYTYRAAGAG